MGAITEPCSNEVLLGALAGVDLDSIADQLITLQEGNKRITLIIFANASGTTAAVTGGLYTQAAKAGPQVINAAQTYAALTATKTLRPSVNNDYVTGTDLYVSFDVAEGSASTCDVYVFGTILGEI